VVAKEQGVLFDYHVACEQATTAHGPSRLTGKPLYRSICLSDPDLGRGHTTSTDLESLYYTLLDFASDGKAIRWRFVLPKLMDDMKYASMAHYPVWKTKVLPHCLDDLHAPIRRVHALFFPPPDMQYKTPPSVTPVQFLQALCSET
jgi:hypothetical protein